MYRSNLPVLALALALLPLLSGTGRGARAEADDANFVERALANVTLGDGIQTDQVILFPLLAQNPPPDLGVTAQTATRKIVFAEPEFPRRRHDLQAVSTDDHPVLVLGGAVLAGGYRDRFVTEDALVLRGVPAEIRTLPASAPSETRDEAAPFQLSETLGTSYLRETAQFGGGPSLVPIFVTHFLDFLNEGDKRRSLAAISESDLLGEYCLVCQDSLASFIQGSAGARVVGLVTAIRGRVQSLELFGTNSLLRANFSPILKGHAFAAAAIELRAKKAGVPLPGRDDPKRTLEATTKAAHELVGQLRRATYRDDAVAPGQGGQALLLRTPDGTRGRALGLDEKLAHLAVFPYDPFEHALYARALNPPKEGEDYEVDREGLLELERRDRRGTGGRLTEAERRILERLRQR